MSLESLSFERTPACSLEISHHARMHDELAYPSRRFSVIILHEQMVQQRQRHGFLTRLKGQERYSARLLMLMNNIICYKPLRKKKLVRTIRDIRLLSPKAIAKPLY